MLVNYLENFNTSLLETVYKRLLKVPLLYSLNKSCSQYKIYNYNTILSVKSQENRF